MDKKANRTGMLAAGRKKLEQFRQKKEGKGSSSRGKSSDKSSQAGSNGNADPVLVDAAVPVDDSSESKLGEGESLPVIDADAASLGPGNMAMDAEVAVANSSDSAPAMNEGHRGMETDGDSSVGVTVMTTDAETVPVDLWLPFVSEKVGEADAEFTTSSLPPDKTDMLEADGRDIEPVDEGGENLATGQSSTTVDEGCQNLALADSSTQPEMMMLYFSSPSDLLHSVSVEEANEMEVQMVGDAQSSSAVLDQEAQCSGLDQRDRNDNGNNRQLQTGDEDLEVRVLGMELAKHATVAASDSVVGDAVGGAGEGDMSYVLGEICPETAGTTSVIEHVDASGSKDEDAGKKCGDGENMTIMSSLQDFATEHKRAASVGEHEQCSFTEGAAAIVSTSTHNHPEEQQASLVGRAISLVKVLEGLDEEEVHFLLKSRQSASMTDDELRLGKSTEVDGSIADGVENIKQHLFLTNIDKDYLHLQLVEQLEAQMNFHQREKKLLDELSKLEASVLETREINMSISDELTKCRSELHVMGAENEKLELQVLSARSEVEEHKAIASGLFEKLEQSRQESAQLFSELASCNELLGTLQMENADLSRNLSSAAEERNKFEAEKEYFASENMILAVELSEHKKCVVVLENTQMLLEAEKESLTVMNGTLSAELSGYEQRLAIVHDAQMQLEANLNKAMADLERCTEENFFLSGSLDLYRDKVKEFDERYQQLFAQATIKFENSISPGTVNDQAAVDSHLVIDKNNGGDTALEVSGILGHAQGQSHPESEGKGSGDSVGLFFLKGHTQDAIKAVKKLENAIQGIHSQSAALSRLSDKSSPAGVSKLIQAFESKVHQDDAVPDDVSVLESECSADPLKVAQEQTLTLRALLEQLEWNTEKANELLMCEQQSKNVATVALKALEVEHEVQKKWSSNLEEKNNELVLKLSNYQSRIDDLTHQCSDIQQNALNSASIVLNQVEGLQKEMVDKMSTLEQEQMSLTGIVSEAIEKLNSCIGPVAGSISANSEKSDLGAYVIEVVNASIRAIESLQQERTSLVDSISGSVKRLDMCIRPVVSLTSVSHEQPDVVACATGVIDAAIGTIEDLHMKLEEAYTLHEKIHNAHEELNLDFADVQGRSKNAVGMLNQIYHGIKKLTIDSGGNKEAAEMLTEADELLDLVPGDCELLIKQLEKLVNQRQEAIEDLHMKLEEAYSLHEKIHTAHEELNRNFADVQGQSKIAVGMLSQIYHGVKKLTIDSCGSEAAAETLTEADELLDMVPSDCELLIKQLEKLVNERQDFLCSKSELEHELINRTHSIEELNKKCVLLGNKAEDLESKLMKGNQAVEELNKLCVNLLNMVEENENSPQPEAIFVLLDNFLSVIQSKEIELDPVMLPVRRLEASVALIVQKYRGVVEQVSLSKDYLLEFISRQELSEGRMIPLHNFLREEFGPKLMELHDLKEKMHQLNSSDLHRDNEVCLLKENLSKMEEALEAAHSELQVKGTELEQSEQRLSSVREKLSLAVVKGKGLIVQRDSLKQSLTDKSSELEKCMQELDSKVALLNEVESKLKAYSEAGERVEALETELSYIRNSATALRESFLLKDSVLQRIEETLEDLELPEHFHSQDIIEKIEWLARSVTGNSLPLNDWDQKSSVGGSYSDGGFVVMDAWKDEVQPSLNPAFDDLRKKYDELQSKFYGLAEHNEMLEQSLLERNNLIQRWEEVLERIDIPLQLRSMEPEDKIEWLGRAVSEAQQVRDAFRMKIEDLENSSDSLIAELDDAHNKLDDLRAKLVAVTHEKEQLSESMEKLVLEHQKMSEKAGEDDSEKGNLLKEIADLQEKLTEKVASSEHIDADIKRLQGLLNHVLPNHDMEDTVSGGSSTECLEGLLKMLIDKYMSLSLERSMAENAEECLPNEAGETLVAQCLKDVHDVKEQELLLLKGQFDTALSDVVLAKEEKDEFAQRYRSLMLEHEAISKERDDLLEKCKQEEQKTASLREKLNVAVRKGKGLLQQRDAMKQTIEEMHAEVEHLKIELSQRENTLLQYEQKIQDLSAYSEKVDALTSENSMLRKLLAETEKRLQESEQTLSSLLTALHAIDIGGQVNSNDPVQKMEQIVKWSGDFHAASVSLQQEAKKSKRAAELLVAELNEVQERADIFQEELEKARNASTELFRQKEKLEAARLEVHSKLEQIIYSHEEEKKRQLAYLLKLKTGVDQLQGEFFGLANVLANLFPKDLDLLHNVQIGILSFVKHMNSTNSVGHSLPHASPDVFSSISLNEVKTSGFSPFLEQKMHSGDSMTEGFGIVGHGLQECIREVNDLKRKCHTHEISFEKQATYIPQLMEAIQKEVSSQNEASESLRKEVAHLETLRKEKDAEISLLQKNISFLYEACSKSLAEIEDRKVQMVENGLPSGVHLSGKTGMTFPMCIDRKDSAGGGNISFTEESIRTMTDALLLAVKGSANIQIQRLEGNERELKATISNLQNELQEKDIQSNRICSELVTQIKEAEATAKRYMVELESAMSEVDNLEKQLESMKDDQKSLEMRIKELRDYETLSKELQEKIRSLSDGLSGKDQEIENLMQALDEEESQMEDLSNQVAELEKTVQQKNLALESLEASRGKAMAKLSTTVSKFDELHHLSENLLLEVENLQKQLQARDSEISFLRQEVTRCTNDALMSQENNKRSLTEMRNLLTWLSTVLSRFGVHDVQFDDHKGSQMIEVMEKHITLILSEIDDLKLLAQSKETLLQAERSKVGELSQKGEILEISLREKESQLALFQGAADSGQTSSISNLDMDGEPMINKRVGPIAPHIRSLRKINNDQVAIAVDVETGNNTLDDEDDDKVHGFKSLTMSRIVPTVTRPIADRIDGIWVSGERMLMRQPTLRLGVVIYWDLNLFFRIDFIGGAVG
ncbi:hypothetical protein ACLOJK_030791 [Asimina triloba]